MNNCLISRLARIAPFRYYQRMAYNPPKRLSDKEIDVLCRIFGVTPEALIETADRVEFKRCDTCGSLRCQA